MTYRDDYEREQKAESMRHFKRELGDVRALYNPNTRKAKKTLGRILADYGAYPERGDNLLERARDVCAENVLECALSFCCWNTPTPRWFYGGAFAGFTRWCELEGQEYADMQAWQCLLAYGGPAYGFYVYVGHERTRAYWHYSASRLCKPHPAYRVFWFYCNWGYGHSIELTGVNAEAVLDFMAYANPAFPLQ